MAIPDFQTIMRPTLALLADGETRSTKQVIAQISDDFGLTDEERAEVVPSGTNRRINDKVHWALTHVFQAGLIERPQRGHVRITERGRETLALHPDRIDMSVLSTFPSYVDFRTRTRASGPPRAPDAAAQRAVEGESSPQDLVAAATAENSAAVAGEVLERLASMDPAAFERLVLRVLTALGYGGRSGAVEHTGRTGDGGIDGIIRQDPLGLERVYMQAKRYAADNAVGRPAVQAFVGALHGQQADRGVFITTSSFSRDAVEYVRYLRKRIVLVDGHRLAELMVLNNVGVQDERTFTLKRLDEDFFEAL